MYQYFQSEKMCRNILFYLAVKYYKTFLYDDTFRNNLKSCILPFVMLSDNNCQNMCNNMKNV